MSRTKYWLDLWQGHDNISIDFNGNKEQRDVVIEALKDTNVVIESYESHIDL